MDHDHAIGRERPRSRPRSITPALLEGRALTVARLAWLLIATLSVSLFVAAVPFHYRQLLTACVREGCHAWQLSAQSHLALQALGLSSSIYAMYAIALASVQALAYCAAAVLIFWRRSNEWMALLAALWLVTFGTMAHAPEALAVSQPLLRPLIGFLSELGWAYLPPLFLLTFPDGRFIPRWTRWLFGAFLMAGFIGSVLEVYLPDLAQGPGERVLWFSMILTGIGTQLYRYGRVSDTAQRQQTKWVVFGLVVATLSIALWAVFLQPLPLLSEPGLPTLAGKLLEMSIVNGVLVLVALTIGYSILRYRLWDIDIIIKRALIWGALSGIVIGVYVLIVGGLGALFQSRGSFLPSMLATGVIALLFHPLRQRVQRGVNRLMYGERDEPNAVLSRLGRRLEGTLASEAVLPTIVETVAQALRLPYVAITLNEGDAFQFAASTGDPVAGQLVLPLTYQGELLSQLICGPRSGDQPFRGEERRLLEDVARQAGVAVQAVQSNADLRRSRERLVITREEERRRIRRDLHDGLGPALASQALKIGSARALLRRDPEMAERLLEELETDVNEALKDIRRLVYNLRPPSLDEVGLLRAMQQDAPRYPGLNVSFALRPALPELSAAVEVAVYRIVQEALANVVRHAGARNVLVRMKIDAGLRLSVADDGQGLPADYRSGVGLRSMRERAEELGGSFKVKSAPGEGTTIEVWLPLRGKEA